MKVFKTMLAVLSLTLFLNVGNVLSQTDIRGEATPDDPEPEQVDWASGQFVFNHGDGSFTFMQLIDRHSTPPHYNPSASSGGFNRYSFYDEDFGWQHSFPMWDKFGVQIESVQLAIRAYDVDAHKPDPEIDNVYADGKHQGNLEGRNRRWRTTRFDIPVDLLSFDGKLKIKLDIDATHDYDEYGVKVRRSILVVEFRFCGYFDSDKNVGPAPLVANFWTLHHMHHPRRPRRPDSFIDLRPRPHHAGPPEWWMGDLTKEYGEKVSHTYTEADPSYDSTPYDVGLHGIETLEFVKVYAPNPECSYAHLQVVKASPAAESEPWDNAVDGDIFGKSGTATVANDNNGVWAIFEFTDQSVKKISKLRLLTDTGIHFRKRQVKKFSVYVSTTDTAPSSFTHLLSGNKKANDTPCDLHDDWKEWSVTPTEAKYIKFVVDWPMKPYWRQIGEFEVYENKTLAKKAVEAASIPTEYALGQAYPNPFNPATKIDFQLPMDTNVTLKVYNVSGQEIATLVDGFTPAGNHTVEWNAIGVPSGIYVYRLTSNNFNQSARVLLLK